MDLGQAIRDFDFILHLREPNSAIQNRERVDRVAQFNDCFDTRGFPIKYRAFVKPPSLDSDLLMSFINRHLPKKLAWSRSERRRRQQDYNNNEKPLEYSTETRFLASVVITFMAASWLIVPIVIMTIPQTVSRAWDLSTMSIAIVLFGGFAAVVAGPQSSTKDVIAATAAYTAVLVIFYGNIVDNKKGTLGSP